MARAWTRALSLSAAAVHCTCLLSRLLVTVLYPRPSGVPVGTPARPFPSRGNTVESEEHSPLRETTSAAYGVGRDSIAGGVAERCQVSAFSVTTAGAKGLPDEESRTRHAPSKTHPFPSDFTLLPSHLAGSPQGRGS